MGKNTLTHEDEGLQEMRSEEFILKFLVDIKVCGRWRDERRNVVAGDYRKNAR